MPQRYLCTGPATCASGSMRSAWTSPATTGRGCGTARRSRARTRGRTRRRSRTRRTGRPSARSAAGACRAGRTPRANGAVAGPSSPDQVGQRQTGVDDVLDEHHVPVEDVGLQVLDDPHPAGPGGVGRDGEEVDLRDDRELADQVGEEEHAALEHGDEEDAVGVGGRELAGRGGARRRATLRRGSRYGGPPWVPTARPCTRAGPGGPGPPADRCPRSASSSRASSACWRAWGLRCLSNGMTTCSKNQASRSAAVLYMRRCRASTP